MNFEDIILAGLDEEKEVVITDESALALIEEAEEAVLYMDDEIDEATAAFTPAKIYKEYKDELVKLIGTKLIFKPLSIVDGGVRNDFWQREWQVSTKGIGLGQTSLSIGGLHGNIAPNKMPNFLFDHPDMKARINAIAVKLNKKYDSRTWLLSKKLVSEEQLPDKDELKPGDRVSIRKNVTKYGGMGGKCVQVKTNTVSVKIDDGPDKNITFAKSELVGET